MTVTVRQAMLIGVTLLKYLLDTFNIKDSSRITFCADSRAKAQNRAVSTKLAKNAGWSEKD